MPVNFPEAGAASVRQSLRELATQREASSNLPIKQFRVTGSAASVRVANLTIEACTQLGAVIAYYEWLTEHPEPYRYDPYEFFERNMGDKSLEEYIDDSVEGMFERDEEECMIELGPPETVSLHKLLTTGDGSKDEHSSRLSSQEDECLGTIVDANNKALGYGALVRLAERHYVLTARHLVLESSWPTREGHRLTHVENLQFVPSAGAGMALGLEIHHGAGNRDWAFVAVEAPHFETFVIPNPGDNRPPSLRLLRPDQDPMDVVVKAIEMDGIECAEECAIMEGIEIPESEAGAPLVDEDGCLRALAIGGSAVIWIECAMDDAAMERAEREQQHIEELTRRYEDLRKRAGFPEKPEKPKFLMI